MKKNILYFVFAVIISFSLTSCFDERDFEFDRIATTQINPTLGVGHVATIDLSLMDVINFETLADTSGFGFDTINDGFGSYMVFSMQADTTFAPEIPEIGSIPGMTTDIELDLPEFSGTIVGDLYFPSLDESMDSISVDLPSLEDGQTIERIKLKKGSVYIGVATDLNHEAYIELYSPNLKSISKNTEYRQSIKISNANQTTAMISTSEINLSDYEILNNLNDKICFYYRVYIKVNGSINRTYNTNLDIEFAKLEFDYIYGKVGNFQETFSDSQELDLFSDSTFSKIFKDGAFEFDDDVYLDLTTITNIGIPATIKLNQVKAYNSLGSIVDLINPKTISIIPAVNPNSFSTTTERLKINANAISTAPNRIDYDAEIKLNPDNITGFVTSDASFRVKTKLTFPFKIKLNNLDYDVEMEELDLEEISKYVNNAKLFLDIKNGFPFDLKAQILTFDENGNLQDSVFQTPIFIQGAPVDSYGAILDYASIQYIKTEVLITSEKFEVLRNAKSSKIRLVLNTSKDQNGNKPFIRLSNNAKLNMKLGVEAEANLSFDLK